MPALIGKALFWVGASVVGYFTNETVKNMGDSLEKSGDASVKIAAATATAGALYLYFKKMK